MLLPRSPLIWLLPSVPIAVARGAAPVDLAAENPLADVDSLPELRVLPESWGPRETVRSPVDNMGVSPRPTSPPRRWDDDDSALFKGLDLVKRATGYTMSTDTCGFVASSWSNAYTCGRIGATCSNDGKFMGCCSTNTCTAIKTKCIPYAESLLGACNSTTNAATLCCSTSTRALCYAYTFSTTATPGSTLTLVACDSKTGTGLLLDYPPEYTRSTSTTSSTASAKATTSTKSSQTSGSSGTGASSPGATTSGGASDAQQSSSSTPVGAIAGGVVGGVAVIAIAAVGILLMVRRSKKAEAKASTSSSPPVAQTFPPTSPFVSPSTPGYGGGGPSPGAPPGAATAYGATAAAAYGNYPPGVAPGTPGAYLPAPGTPGYVPVMGMAGGYPAPPSQPSQLSPGPYGSQPPNMQSYPAPSSLHSSPASHSVTPTHFSGPSVYAPPNMYGQPPPQPAQGYNY